eukprot:7093400-Prymnesium_polylepis.1
MVIEVGISGCWAGFGVEVRRWVWGSSGTVRDSGTAGTQEQAKHGRGGGDGAAGAVGADGADVGAADGM